MQKKHLISLSCALGGLLIGHLVGASAFPPMEKASSEEGDNAQPTRRVIKRHNRLGISSFLAENARHEQLPIGYRDKRDVMHDRLTSPFRLQAVLYHHMDNLDEDEVIHLVANQELTSDREIELAFKKIAEKNPQQAVELCLEHAPNLRQRLLSLRAIYQEWAHQDPKAMFAYIDSFPTGGQKMIHSYHFYLSLEQNDISSLVKDYQHFPDNHIRERVISKGMKDWLKKDEQAAIDFTSSIANPAERGVFMSLIPSQAP